jgi:predicted unusual protein kinase regulating ubiquinone biosynthesis (AarF/ABC1/UbiB family)
MTFRFLRAYYTTFVVLFSYTWLGFKGRFMSQERLEARRFELNRKNAKRIEATILTLQGLFIKVGQLFSIMTNFIPEELRAGLRDLQDAVPARPYHQIEQRIREELGKSPEALFETFNKTPIASASLGQVHEATTRDGQRVAVKVQHLGVGAMAESDLKTIRRIIGIVKFFVKIHGLDNFYQEIRTMIKLELDFKNEADHIEAIAENFKGNDKYVFPRVVKELSTGRVLTMEFVEGVKISDSQKLKASGLDASRVAEDLVIAYCQMIFVDGLYHADPHPGNLLIQEDGRIVFLDFGAVGHLSANMRQGVSSFLEAIIKADEAQLIKSLETMGFLRTSVNESEAATRVIEHFHQKFQEEIKLENFSLSSIKIDTRKGLESLADLRQMDVGLRELSASFYVPKEWVLLERAVLLLTGICTHLDPHMNPAGIIRPYLEEFVLGKDRDWSEMVFDLLKEKLLSFISLPSMVEKVVNRSLAGKVSFNVKGLPEGVERLYAAGHQLIYTLLAIVSSGFGLYFYDKGDFAHARWAAYATCGFLLILFVSFLRARRFGSRR